MTKKRQRNSEQQNQTRLRNRSGFCFVEGNVNDISVAFIRVHLR